MAELACIVVHPNYQSDGKGDMLIEYMEKRARQHDIKQLFVLTTQTLHWFQERGFKRADISILPKKKRDLYNFRRNSRVAVKSL
jgi:amino-acid N-acetyltransferase